MEQLPGLRPGLGLGPAHPSQGEKRSQAPHFLAQVMTGEDIFRHGHAPEKLDILKGAGQAQRGPAVRRQAHQVISGQPDGAGSGGQQPVDDIETGGFPRAVGADEPNDITGGHGERDPLQGFDPAEMFGQAID